MLSPRRRRSPPRKTKSPASNPHFAPWALAASLAVAAGGIFAHRRFARPSLPWADLMAQAESLNRARHYAEAAGKAETAWRRLRAEKGPASDEALDAAAKLAAFYAEANEWKKLDKLKKSIEALSLKTFEFYRAEGRILAADEEPRQAAKAFEKALSLDPSDLGLYGDLGRAYKMMGDYHNAIKAYARAKRLAPRQADAYVDEGYAKLAHGDKPEDTKRLFEKAAALTADSGHGLHHLADFYRRSGRTTKSIAAFKRAIHLESSALPSAQINAEPQDHMLLNMGVSLEQNGDRTGALSAFQAAFAATPPGNDIWFLSLIKIAAAAQESGHWRKALNLYREAERDCALHEGHPRNYCFGILALDSSLHCRFGKHLDALRLYGAALAARPREVGYAYSYYPNVQYLAEAAGLLGHTRTAERLFKEILTDLRRSHTTDHILNGFYFAALSGLADLYDREGRRRDAARTRAEASREGHGLKP